MKNAKNVIWIAASGAIAATHTAGQTQPTSAGPTLAPPGSTAMSNVTKGQVNAWVNRIKMVKPSMKPSDDPDYSEFWIELHKKNNVEPEVLPGGMSLLKPLSGQVIANSTPKGLKVENRKLQDLTPYILKKGLAFADWSENAWAEIGPEYAEMSPHPTDMVGKKKSNAVLTIRALDQGKVVSPAYHQEILKQIRASTAK